MKVFALTPTGLRPEGLALLAEYINAQSYAHAFTWIVVDDCDPATRIPAMRDGITVVPVRPDWRWRPGTNTQAACMNAGLALVPDDAALFVLEDDDVYLRDYMITMREALERVELVGERDARYYNVLTRRWKVLPSQHHSSLASTVCRGAALAELKRLCAGGLRRTIDLTLWRTFVGGQLLDEHNVIGIKGLPGRPGIGVGHRNGFGVPDTTGVLQSWLGSYAENYDLFRSAA